MKIQIDQMKVITEGEVDQLRVEILKRRKGAPAFDFDLNVDLAAMRFDSEKVITVEVKNVSEEKVDGVGSSPLAPGWTRAIPWTYENYTAVSRLVVAGLVEATHANGSAVVFEGHPVKTKKCECGAVACGGALRGPGHSRWCPVYSEDDS